MFAKNLLLQCDKTSNARYPTNNVEKSILCGFPFSIFNDSLFFGQQQQNVCERIKTKTFRNQSIKQEILYFMANEQRYTTVES